MKIKGLNATELNSESTLLEHVYIGKVLADDDNELECNIPALTESQCELICKLEQYFCALRDKCKVAKPNVSPIVIGADGNVLLRAGDACHAIPTTDSMENLMMRIESIAQNGILCSEWFGIRYWPNEVPYRASFSRIEQDGTVDQTMLAADMIGTKRVELSQTDNIQFFVDINNPLLAPLIKSNSAMQFSRTLGAVNVDDEVAWESYAEKQATSSVESLKKQLEQLRKIVHDTKLSESFKGLDYFVLLREYNCEFIKKVLNIDVRELNKNNELRSQSWSIRDQLAQIDFDTLLDEFIKSKSEEVYKKKYAEQYQWIKDKNSQYKQFFASAFIGVPAEFITGIRIPQKLEDDVQLIDFMHKQFPGVTIFNSHGNVLVNGTVKTGSKKLK